MPRRAPRRASWVVVGSLALATPLITVAGVDAAPLPKPRVTISGGTFLHIDVNPNLPGSSSWTFALQRRASSGSWTRVGTYLSVGRLEIRDLAVGSGTYRVVVSARRGYAAATSAAFAYTPTPVVRFSGGDTLRVDVDPALPGTGAWPLTIQRFAAGTWSTFASTSTAGTVELASVPAPSGTYRAVVGARGRFPAYVSRAYAYVNDPSGAGGYAVARTTTTLTRGPRSIPVTAFLPSAPAGSAPLLLLLPGFQVSTSAYEATAAHVARHGYAVVLVDRDGSFTPSHLDDRDDALAAITWATGATGPAVVRDSAVAVAGHSLGGKIATMVALADSRVDALFGIDPVDTGSFAATSTRPDVAPSQVGALTIPVGFLGETLDSVSGFMPCAPAADNYTQFYAGTTAAVSAVQWTAAGAGHFSFVDVEPLAASACQTPTAAKATVLAALRTTLTAFVARHLRGDTTQQPWLIGAKVPAILSVVHRP